MKEVKAGNTEAFEEVYERYFDKLTWFAQQFNLSLSEAEDMVQEVFIKVIEQPYHYDDQRTFSTWIYTLVANRCKNLLRDKQNRQDKLNSYPSPDHVLVHSRIDSIKLEQEIKKALSSLEENDRLLFHLRFNQLLPLKDIAEISNTPLGTVKSKLFYLLKKLSKQLKDF